MQFARDLSTRKGYRGYGAEQGNKVEFLCLLYAVITIYPSIPLQVSEICFLAKG